jgi:hypothetical protein
LAKPGDVVEVAGGNYPAQTIVRGESDKNPVTFQAASGQTVTVTGVLQLGANCCTGAPSYLTFDRINIANGCLHVTYGGRSRPSTRITYKNAHIWATTSDGCHLVYLKSTDAFTLSNVELGPMCCGGDALEFGIPTEGDPNPSNILIDRVFIHDIYDTCRNMPSALKSQYGCSGSGYGDTGTGAHVDGIQAFGCTTCTIQNSRIYSINPTSATTTGAAQGIVFLPANGGTFSNLTFTNNMICGADGTVNFAMGGPGISIYSGYIKFLYNTLCTQAPRIYDSVARQRVLAPGTTVVFAGNIMPTHYTHDNTSTSCTFTAGDGSTITPIYKNNLWGAGSACDSSDRLGSATFAAKDFFSPDLHLSGQQTAINGGEAAYCPTLDVDGDRRAAGIACDIGADEKG